MNFMTTIKISALFGCLLLSTSCISHSENDTEPDKQKTAKPIVVKKDTVIDATAKPQEVPVLCYHAIRDVGKNASSDKKTYSVSPLAFAEQMKALSDEGYTTISPDALYNALKSGKALPQKPVMITFDDGREEQYSIGAQEMKKYNFKGVFFIMTIATGKKGYLSRDQIKALSEDGHTIGCHTYDHQNVKHYTDKDWQLQLVKPKKVLEGITQKPVAYFAYPFGVWNEATADSLQKDGYKLAFLISRRKDPGREMYTLPRMIVPGSYSANDLIKAIKRVTEVGNK